MRTLFIFPTVNQTFTFIGECNLMVGNKTYLLLIYLEFKAIFCYPWMLLSLFACHDCVCFSLSPPWEIASRPSHVNAWRTATKWANISADQSGLTAHTALSRFVGSGARRTRINPLGLLSSSFQHFPLLFRPFRPWESNLSFCPFFFPSPENNWWCVA